MVSGCGILWTDGDFDADDVEPMQGLHVSDAAPFDRWLSGEQDRIRTLLKRRAATSRVRIPSATSQGRPYSPDAWVLHARGHYLFLRSAHGGSGDDRWQGWRTFSRSPRGVGS